MGAQIEQLAQFVAETGWEDIPEVVQLVVSKRGGSNSYIIFTQEQQIFATAWLGLPSDKLQRLEAGLLKTGEFRLIYTSSEAQILQFIGIRSQ